MGLVREDVASGLEDLVDQAIALERGEGRISEIRNSTRPIRAAVSMTGVVDVAHIIPIGILAGDSEAMILSSANILEILQGSAVIRMAAGEIRIVDKKPIASGREGFYVYIERYPTVEEFEATWKIWIESDGSEPDDLLLAEMRQLLPNFTFRLGLIIEATVRDFKSEKTEVRPAPQQAPVVMPPSGWMDGIEKRFEALAEDLQDRMLLVNSGRPGKDGERGPEGRPGAPGRDGRDGKGCPSYRGLPG